MRRWEKAGKPEGLEAGKGEGRQGAEGVGQSAWGMGKRKNSEVGSGIHCRPKNSGYEFVEGSPSAVSPGPNGSSQASRVEYQPLAQMIRWAKVLI